MGYVPPPMPAAIITLPPGVSHNAAEEFRAQLRRAYSTPIMVVGHGVRVTPAPYSTPRLWADRHLEALGYGLVGSIAAFIATVAWVLVR